MSLMCMELKWRGMMCVWNGYSVWRYDQMFEWNGIGICLFLWIVGHCLIVGIDEHCDEVFVWNIGILLGNEV